MKFKNFLTVCVMFLLGATMGSGMNPTLALAMNPENGTPTELWQTYYGSPNQENGAGIATDADGNIYVAGTGDATWQGEGDAAPLHPYSGSTDIFVFKLDRNGAYQWHTFYGSVDSDTAAAIALDAVGNVYVTGSSELKWQGDGGIKPLHKAGGGFVLKLNNQGAYQWHTFYPFAASGIAIDKERNVFATGNSASTWKGDGGIAPLQAHSNGSDITVLKLDSQGKYQWHTFYGPSDATGIAIGKGNGIFVAGNSSSNWLGQGATTPLHAYTGDGASDFVVLALKNDGAYRWHTFYGGLDEDYAGNLATDKKGNIFVTGASWNNWLGDNNQTPIASHGTYFSSSYFDTALLKLENAGAYQWHTFGGVQVVGTNGVGGQHVATDQNGTPHVLQAWKDEYLAGDNTPCGPAPCSITFLKAFKFSAGGTYQESLGISGIDKDASAAGIATDKANNTLMLGSLGGGWGGVPLHPHRGANDAFVLKGNFAEPIPPKLTAPPNNAMVAKQIQTLNWNDTADTTNYNIELRQDNRNGAVIADTSVTLSEFVTPQLTRGKTYFWHVQSCNDLGCSIWSRWWKFEVKAK